MRFRLQLIGQNSYMLSARIFTLAITFLITAMSARFLVTVMDFGQLILISAYYIFLREISVFSFKTYLVREIIKNKEQPMPALTHIFLFSSILIISGAMLIAGILYSLGYSRSIIILSMALNLSLIFEVFIHNNESYFESHKRFDHLFYSHFTYGVLRILLFLGINLNNPTLTGIISSFIFSSFAGSLAHVFILHNYLIKKKDYALSKSRIKKTFVISAIFFVSSIFYGLLNSLDIMILSKLSGNISVGLFAPAARMNKFCFIYAFSFISVLYPHFVSFLNNDPEKLPAFAGKSFTFIIFSIIPLQFLFPYVAKYVIYFFFGSQYSASILLLKILIFCQMPFAVYFFCSRYFLALHREKLTVLIDFLSLLFHFSALIFFIRIFDKMGAAIGVVSTNIFLAVIYLIFLKRQKISFPYIKILFKNLIFLIITGFFFMMTFSEVYQPFHDIISMVIIIAISLAAFFMMKELEFIRKRKKI
ncbi:MAG: oligosaccharide flippase family protein [Candidatus Aureabacteria bacterium]|nr:oligosaccharide flippase family protein [Candidatus Auribacterota bacterium]